MLSKFIIKMVVIMHQVDIHITLKIQNFSKIRFCVC